MNFVAGYQINPNRNTDKKTLGQHFFKLYFKNFKHIVLANILFIIPIIIAAAYVYLTYAALGGINLIAAASAIIILNPFVSGLTMVSRCICEERSFTVSKTFFKGMKENWTKFLIHGIIIYIVFLISYFSLSTYLKGTASSGIYWIPFVITALISLLAIFALYYANIMTVTIDIKLKDIYRNCVLFSFGELKNNFFVTLALFIFCAVIFFVLAVFFSPILLIIVGGLLTVLIIPETIQYIITYFVYNDMIAILDKSAKTKKQEQPTAAPAPAPPVVEKEEAEEISRLAPNTQDEYIFHNGRMIKRSIIESQLNSTNDDDF